MSRHPIDKEIKITPHEQQIIALLMQDLQRKSIYLQLHIKPSTLDTEMKNLHEKLGCHTSAGVVSYAFTHGFVFDFEHQKVYYLNQLIN